MSPFTIVLLFLTFHFLEYPLLNHLLLMINWTYSNTLPLLRLKKRNTLRRWKWLSWLTAAGSHSACSIDFLSRPRVHTSVSFSEMWKESFCLKSEQLGHSNPPKCGKMANVLHELIRRSESSGEVKSGGKWIMMKQHEAPDTVMDASTLYSQSAFEER